MKHYDGHCHEQQSDSHKNNRGMPICLDDRIRSVVDSVEANDSSNDWYPSNSVTLKLWHCLEALRDIDLVLEAASHQKIASKRKRKLKMLSIHLFSFAGALSQLCNQIVGDKSIHGGLAPKTTIEVAEIKKEFLGLVPIDWKGDLTQIRNKLGAHIDSKLWPWQAHVLLQRSILSNFGRWLHICIHVLLDLIKLDIYSWSCNDASANVVRLMTCEPFLVTLQVADGKPNSIIAVHIAQQSPRESIINVVTSVITHSQWMFHSGERHIVALKIDKGTHWNTFIKGHAIWKDE